MVLDLVLRRPVTGAVPNAYSNGWLVLGGDLCCLTSSHFAMKLTMHSLRSPYSLSQLQCYLNLPCGEDVNTAALIALCPPKSVDSASSNKETIQILDVPKLVGW